MIDTKALTESIYDLCSIRTIVQEKDVDGTVHLVSCEESSTDAIRLVIGKKNYLIEILPVPDLTKEEVAIFEHSTIEDACKMFEALHFFRDCAVKPLLNNISEMI